MWLLFLAKWQEKLQKKYVKHMGWIKSLSIVMYELLWIIVKNEVMFVKRADNLKNVFFSFQMGKGSKEKVTKWGAEYGRNFCFGRFIEERLNQNLKHDF